MFFAGQMDYAKLSFVDRLLAKAAGKASQTGEGDQRDWASVRGWAQTILAKAPSAPHIGHANILPASHSPKLAATRVKAVRPVARVRPGHALNSRPGQSDDLLLEGISNASIPAGGLGDAAALD